jgi:hypothetical protein
MGRSRNASPSTAASPPPTSRTPPFPSPASVKLASARSPNWAGRSPANSKTRSPEPSRSGPIGRHLPRRPATSRSGASTPWSSTQPHAWLATASTPPCSSVSFRKSEWRSTTRWEQVTPRPRRARSSSACSSSGTSSSATSSPAKRSGVCERHPNRATGPGVAPPTATGGTSRSFPTTTKATATSAA